MCPVVIVVVISLPEGNLISPQRKVKASFDSGGVNVTSSTPGKRVQRIEIAAKFDIPIRAISLRV
jgi:hypothetical protein